MHTALQATAAPKVDLIINAFTLTGVALMCGEAHGIPVAGFCLQPTCIPSDDEDWHATAPATTSDPGCNRIYPGCEPILSSYVHSLSPCVSQARHRAHRLEW